MYIFLYGNTELKIVYLYPFLFLWVLFIILQLLYQLFDLMKNAHFWQSADLVSIYIPLLK